MYTNCLLDGFDLHGVVCSNYILYFFILEVMAYLLIQLTLRFRKVAFVKSQVK